MSEQVNFSSLNLPIPDIVKIYPYEKKREIFDYLFSFLQTRRSAYGGAYAADSASGGFSYERDYRGRFHKNGFIKKKLESKLKSFLN